MNNNNNKSNMDMRSVVAIALCVLFYLGYSRYLSVKYPNYNKQTPQETTQTAPTNSQAPNIASTPTARPSATTTATGSATTRQPAAETIQQLSDSDLTIETDTSVYRFSQQIGGIDSITLKNYKREKGKNAKPVDVLENPLVLQGIVDINKPQAAAGFHAERQARTLRFWKEINDWEVSETIKVPEKGYAADIDLTFTNKSGKPAELTAGALLQENLVFTKPEKKFGILPAAPAEIFSYLYSEESSTKHIPVEKYCDKGESEPAAKFENTQINYFGLDSHYFLSVLQPKAKAFSFVMQRGAALPGSCEVTIIGYQPYGLVQPGAAATMSFQGFFGPKDMTILEKYDNVLQQSIDLGFFSFIARPLLTVIHGFYKVLGNYGLAIIVMTLLLKLLFYPLMKASAVSMHRMKKLNPQMNEIREKFKDDKQRQQQELMKFMSQNKVNPMKGCLPVLPQVPVFFAFYQVLRSAIELRHAPFYGWIQDLSAMDPYFVTPILMGLAMVVQQKLTPQAGMDKTQEKIMMFMPLVFTVMMLTLPAGMTLYMLTNTLTGIIQQKWLYKKLDKVAA